MTVRFVIAAGIGLLVIAGVEFELGNDGVGLASAVVGAGSIIAGWIARRDPFPFRYGVLGMLAFASVYCAAALIAGPLAVALAVLLTLALYTAIRIAARPLPPPELPRHQHWGDPHVKPDEDYPPISNVRRIGSPRPRTDAPEEPLFDEATLEHAKSLTPEKIRADYDALAHRWRDYAGDPPVEGDPGRLPQLMEQHEDAEWCIRLVKTDPAIGQAEVGTIYEARFAQRFDDDSEQHGEPPRHYFVAWSKYQPSDKPRGKGCLRCGLPATDPVHLKPSVGNL